MHDRDGTATDIRAICQSTGALAPYALFALFAFFDGTRGISLIAKGKSALFTELSTGNGDNVVPVPLQNSGATSRQKW